MDGIPDALIEAAVVDGAGDIRILRSIIIPLAKPALATTVVLTFQAVWMNAENIKQLYYKRITENIYVLRNGPWCKYPDVCARYDGGGQYDLVLA